MGTYVKMEGCVDGNIKDNLKIWIWRHVAMAMSIISDVGRGSL